MLGHITAVFMIVAGAVAIPATSYQSRVDGYRHGHNLPHVYDHGLNHGYNGLNHGYGYLLNHGYGAGIGHGLGHYNHFEHAWAYPAYKFSYSVHDPHTGDYKSQSEYRHGDLVKGSYSLAEPSGNIRSVHYSADDHHGFNAVIHQNAIHHHAHGHHYPYHH